VRGIDDILMNSAVLMGNAGLILLVLGFFGHALGGVGVFGYSLGSLLAVIVSGFSARLALSLTLV
jgi:hypothetical protein